MCGGRQAAHKKQRKYTGFFYRISPNDVLYLTPFKIITKLTGTIPLSSRRYI